MTERRYEYYKLQHREQRGNRAVWVDSTTYSGTAILSRFLDRVGAAQVDLYAGVPTRILGYVGEMEWEVVEEATLQNDE